MSKYNFILATCLFRNEVTIELVEQQYLSSLVELLRKVKILRKDLSFGSIELLLAYGVLHIATDLIIFQTKE